VHILPIRRGLIALFFVPLAGCPAGSSEPAAGPAQTSAETSVPTATAVEVKPSASAAQPIATSSSHPTGSTAAVAGKYTSPSCDERKYPRELDLGADGQFTSRDLVSPCPPDRECYWSGVVQRKGTFTTNGASITLSPDAGAPTSPGAPFPTQLAFQDGVPIEAPDHSHCVYKKR
jgi:hypothetical protein